MNSQGPSHTFGHLAPTPGAPAGAMRRAILGALRRLRAWRCRRLAIRELERLDAHLLADIGLDRGRIRYVVEGLTGAPCAGAGSGEHTMPGLQRRGLRRRALDPLSPD